MAVIFTSTQAPTSGIVKEVAGEPYITIWFDTSKEKVPEKNASYIKRGSVDRAQEF